MKLSRPLIIVATTVLAAGSAAMLPGSAFAGAPDVAAPDECTPGLCQGPDGEEGDATPPPSEPIDEDVDIVTEEDPECDADCIAWIQDPNHETAVLPAEQPPAGAPPAPTNVDASPGAAPAAATADSTSGGGQAIANPAGEHTGAAPTGQLPFTGLSQAWALVTGMLLVLAGTGMQLVGRRRTVG